MDGVAQQQLIEVANYVENQLDNELAKLDNLDINDFEKLRENRMKELKKQQQQKQNWLSLGHGECCELSDEKELFEVSRKSDHVVCLFYRNDSKDSKIVEHHIKIIAKNHIEAKFCMLSFERCPFLIGRLKIKAVPTIAIVLNNKIKDYIVKFSDSGNGDDITTESLEYRLSLSGAITGNEDSLEAIRKSAMQSRLKIKTIRGKQTDDFDDDI